jgi:hypothetical protein
LPKSETISAESNPEALYSQHKSRCAIEQLFDSFKNLLVTDRTYMRTDEGLEGLMFVNLIALSWYYKIYAKLLGNDLLTHYSVVDVLQRSAKMQTPQLTRSTRSG